MVLIRAVCAVMQTTFKDGKEPIARPAGGRYEQGEPSSAVPVAYLARSEEQGR